MIRACSILALLGLTFAALAPANAASAAIDRADLGAFVDGFVSARLDAHQVVGATVSIVHDGELIFARGYGYDDLAAGRRVDAERTLFRPGSISKTFTWTAVMQLHEQGKLDLDADIRTYLPNLEIADTFESPITLLDLMAHTPGFEDSAMGHLFGDDPHAVPTLLEYLRSHRPARVRPPGLLPAYSNYGVGVAGLIVANVSGMAWEDYADRFLLEPLGMDRSSFREPWSRPQPAPMPARLVRDVSKGYVRRSGTFEPGEFTFIGQIGPAGALSTTATDMARWMLAHLGDGSLGQARILEPDSARQMHRQHFAMHPQMPGIAHGFIESYIHGYRAIGHGGGTIHFLSDMQLIPDLDLGVFISTNTSGGGKLIDDFVATLVARYFAAGPLTLAAGDDVRAGRPLAEYAGTYLSTRRPYTTVERLFMSPGARVAEADDGLLLASPLGETRLTPLGGDDFRDADSGQRVTFTSDAGGAINALLLPVPVLVMERVGPVGDPNLRYGVLLLSALVLACALVGAWLRRRQTLPQTPTEAWAARLLIATAALWLVGYALGGGAAAAALAGDMANVFFAFPSPMFVAALAVGLIAAALTVLSALLLYPVWSTASWPLWRRLRHTAVVLAALATLLILRDFNAIGFNYL